MHFGEKSLVTIFSIFTNLSFSLLEMRGNMKVPGIQEDRILVEIMPSQNVDEADTITPPTG